MIESQRRRGAVAKCTLGLFLLIAVITVPVFSQETDDTALLKQIQEEVKMLRLELAKVSQAVTDMHRKQIAPVAGQPGADIVTELEIKDLQHVFGNPDASVVMLEFSEFQCPYCARFNKQTLGGVKRDYIDTGKIAFVPMDFPLDFHDQAQSAAIFSQCAMEQGKYWEVREALYTNQRDLGDEAYARIAAELELETEAVNECQNRVEVTNSVESSVELGGTLGVRGTPTIFIGKVSHGKIVGMTRIVGAQPEHVVRKLIDSKI